MIVDLLELDWKDFTTTEFLIPNRHYWIKTRDGLIHLAKYMYWKVIGWDFIMHMDGEDCFVLTEAGRNSILKYALYEKLEGDEEIDMTNNFGNELRNELRQHRSQVKAQEEADKRSLLERDMAIIERIKSDCKENVGSGHDEAIYYYNHAYAPVIERRKDILEGMGLVVKDNNRDNGDTFRSFYQIGWYVKRN